MWIFTVVIVAAVSAANVSNSCVVTPLYSPPITCLVIETYTKKDHTHRIGIEWRKNSIWMMQSMHSMQHLQDQRTPCSNRSTIFVCATWFCRSGPLLYAHLPRINAQNPFKFIDRVLKIILSQELKFPRGNRRNSPRLITTILALTIFSQIIRKMQSFEKIKPKMFSESAEKRWCNIW